MQPFLSAGGRGARRSAAAAGHLLHARQRPLAAPRSAQGSGRERVASWSTCRWPIWNCPKRSRRSSRSRIVWGSSRSSRTRSPAAAITAKHYGALGCFNWRRGIARRRRSTTRSRRRSRASFRCVGLGVSAVAGGGCRQHGVGQRPQTADADDLSAGRRLSDRCSAAWRKGTRARRSRRGTSCSTGFAPTSSGSSEYCPRWTARSSTSTSTRSSRCGPARTRSRRCGTG